MVLVLGVGSCCGLLCPLSQLAVLGAWGLTGQQERFWSCAQQGCGVCPVPSRADVCPVPGRDCSWHSLCPVPSGICAQHNLCPVAVWQHLHHGARCCSWLLSLFHLSPSSPPLLPGPQCLSLSLLPVLSGAVPFAPDQTPAIQVSGQRLQLLFSAFRRAWALPACCPSPHQPQALHSLFLPLTPGDFFFLFQLQEQ